MIIRGTFDDNKGGQLMIIMEAIDDNNKGGN